MLSTDAHNFDVLISSAKSASEIAEEILHESGKARYPFRQSEYLGPGPMGMIHASAGALSREIGTEGIPWNCSKVAPYSHMCIKSHPETGEVLRKKSVIFDPEKVRERNVRYRSWAKGQLQLKRQGQLAPRANLGTALQKYPLLQFGSDPNAQPLLMQPQRFRNQR